MNSHALIVLGMHRSGTSATTGLLQALGVHLGKKLYAGHAHINPKGYFEHSNIADTNEAALLAINSAWDDFLPRPAQWQNTETLEQYAKKILRYLKQDFSNAPVWAIKDPRICRLLPWWLPILQKAGVNPKFLILLRHPDDVYLSLKRRDGFSLEKAHLLWLLHYLDAELWTRGLPRALIEFKTLASDPVSAFTAIEKALAFNFPVAPDTAKEALLAFLDHEFIHHQTKTLAGDNPAELPLLAAELYQQLNRISQNAADFNKIDQIRSTVENWQRSFCPLLTEQLRTVYQSRSESQHTLNKVLRSQWWFLGKPVRFLERLFGQEV